MLDDAVVQDFPALVAFARRFGLFDISYDADGPLGSEDFGPAQVLAVQALDSGPPHEFGRGEALDQRASSRR